MNSKREGFEGRRRERERAVCKADKVKAGKGSKLNSGQPLFTGARPPKARIPLSPPLGNNTNSENGFVLFFAVDYFGIIVERN